MKKFLLLTLFHIIGYSLVVAQIDFSSLSEDQLYRPDSTYKKWSLSIAYGPVIYYTDVIDHTFLPSDHLKFGPAIRFAKQFGRSWAIEGQYMMADMYGQKTKYNRYFEGDFFEASLSLKAYLNQLIINGPIADRWNIYGTVGYGLVLFRSSQRRLGEDRILQAGEVYFGYEYGYPNNYSGWNESDYLVMGYDRQSLEKKSREKGRVIPFGLGVEYRINKSFDLGLETTFRNLTSDNLDVDMTGADNDTYMFTSFSLIFNFGRKNKRHSSWTYKDFDLMYQRDRARDPLAQRLDSLKQELDYIAASDTAVSDTTFIYKEEVIKKETFSASVFFDFDKAVVTERSHRTLAGVAKFLKENPDVRIMIQGYTDDRGSYDYNLALSDRRCNAVKSVLEKDYGIDESRMTIEPKGKAELLSDTRLLAPRGIHLVNRRVDIISIIE